MRRGFYILAFCLVAISALAQSVQKQAFQEIRVDTLRPNHYGPVWGIVFAWHDSVRVRIFRDSMNVKNISGDTAKFKYYAGAFTYDTLNHNSQFAKDTLYRAAQESAIRAIIAADSLYRAAQEALRILYADTTGSPPKVATPEYVRLHSGGAAPTKQNIIDSLNAASPDTIKLAQPITGLDAGGDLFFLGGLNEDLTGYGGALSLYGGRSNVPTHTGYPPTPGFFGFEPAGIRLSGGGDSSYAGIILFQAFGHITFAGFETDVTWHTGKVNPRTDSRTTRGSYPGSIYQQTDETNHGALWVRTRGLYDWQKVVLDSMLGTMAYADSNSWTGRFAAKVNTLDSGAVYASWDQTRDSLAAVRASMNAIGGGTAYDTLNHNSQFAKDTTYKAEQDAAIRALQAADSLYRAAQESAIRAVQAADSLYKAAQIAKKVAIADSGAVSPGYVTRTQLRADSLYRAAQESALRSIQAADSTYKAAQLLLRRLISDTTATAGTPTINRLLDSLAHVRSSMNSIGGGGGGALVGILNSDFTTTSTSYVDVTGTSLTVAANSTYMCIISAYMTIDDTGYATLKLVYPSGATGRWSLIWVGTTYSGTVANHGTETTTLQIATGESWGTSYFLLTGVFKTSSTAGTLKMQVIEDFTPGTITVKAGSGISLVKQ